MYRQREMPHISLALKIENWQAQNDQRFGAIVQSFLLSTDNPEAYVQQAKQAWLDSEEGRNASEEARIEFTVNLNAAQYLIEFIRKADAKYPELFPVPVSLQQV
jgi:hypothetical protein